MYIYVWQYHLSIYLYFFTVQCEQKLWSVHALIVEDSSAHMCQIQYAFFQMVTQQNRQKCTVWALGCAHICTNGFQACIWSMNR